jgi:predicted O-methyltransferase YrrM
MNHIYELPEFGENWFNYKSFYKSMVEKFPSGSKFIEIGSWKGKSSAYLAVEIINSEKNISLDCIDTWKGSSEHVAYENITSDNLYELFVKNISSLLSVINPVRLDSISASKNYEDKTIDFIFIDGSHDYESVKADINAWLPKVKVGGIISGHDYGSWKTVTKAVDEFFTDKKVLIIGDCWIYENN